VTGQPVSRFGEGCGGWEARWSPDGKRIVTYGFGAPAQVWDASTGEVITEYAEHDPWHGAWSPDSTRIVTGDYLTGQGPVRVWDAHTGNTGLTLLPEDFPHGSGAVDWSPDGSRIVTFGTDALGRIWDASTGEQLGLFASPPQGPYGPEWSASSSRFLVSTQSGIRVWDAATAAETMVYPTADSAWASWAPDGTAVAIAIWNGDLKVFPAWESLEDLVAYAKEHCVLRELTPEERAQYGLAER